MATPTLVYNASTGSDTAASGAGPATAITGTAAAHTGGVASTTITFTNSPDLSGVDLVADTDVLYLATASGVRHLTRILSVDDVAKTAVVEDTFNIPAGSPVNYAIGGERKTLEADTGRRDPEDWKTSWKIKLRAGTYNHGATITCPTGDATDGEFRIAGYDGDHPTIAFTNVGIAFEVATGNRFANFTATTSGSGTFAFTSSSGSRYNVLLNGVIVDGFDAGIRANWEMHGAVLNSEFRNCINGVDVTANNYYLEMQFIGCWFHDNTIGAEVGANAPRYGAGFDSCIFSDNGDHGIYVIAGAVAPVHIHACTFYNNGAVSTDGDGVNFADVTSANFHANIFNCVFSENAGYGVNGTSAVVQHGFTDFNAYYSNGSGPVNGVSAGDNDVTCTADPFVAKATDDYTPNDNANGGLLLKDAAYPGALAGVATHGRYIGAVQPQEPAGGGGGSINRGILTGGRL